MAGRGRPAENDFMSAKTDNRLSIEKAMSRVLSAEADALAQIVACQSRADGTLLATRKKVRAMVRRTQQRLSRLHAGCDERTHALENVVLPEIRQDLAAMEKHLDLNEQEEVIRVRSLQKRA